MKISDSVEAPRHPSACGDVRARAGNAFRFVEAPFRVVITARAPLLATIANEIRYKYAGSAFGIGWVLLLPLLFLAIYSVTYLFIFKVKPADVSPGDYVLFVYIGLIPFLSFSESLATGASALLTNRAVLLNTVFPAELLPLRVVVACQTTLLVGFGISLLWAAIVGRLSLCTLLLPVLTVAQIMFLIGAAWFLAPIYIVFRDLGSIINFVVLAMLVVSPIAYHASALKPPASVLAQLNPLYYFLIGYQAVLFDGTLPPIYTLLVAIGMGLSIFVLGYHFCNRLKLVVADYV